MDGRVSTLVISPYAPYRDGIATYAVQEVAALRAAGEDVEVLSPLPSAAHHHLVIGSVPGMIRLLRLLRSHRFDRVIVQLFPELLFGSCRTRVERGVVWALLALVGAAAPLELRVHELDYATVEADAVTRALAVRAFRAAAVVSVHTGAEQRALESALGPAAGVAITVVDHGRDFVAHTDADRAGARASLGVPDDRFVFVSIGFVQRHKGFDRAVRSAGRLGADVRHYTVGDIRVDHPDLHTYRDELLGIIGGTPNAEARLGFVSDEEFDRWLVAADCIVLPYREIWSSGVMERAALFGTPVIATRVGGLADQAVDGTVLVGDDVELAAAMAAAAGIELDLDTGTIPRNRSEIEALIRRRAGVRSPDPGEASASEPFGHVAHAVLGRADSIRPGVKQVKRLIQRATAWQVEPIAESVNALIAASIEVTDDLEGRLRSHVEDHGNDHSGR